MVRSNFNLPLNETKFDCFNFGFFVGAYFNFTSKSWYYSSSHNKVKKGQYEKGETLAPTLYKEPTFEEAI